MITPLNYYITKIQKRLENSTKEYETREEMFRWFKWSVSGGFGTCAAISENTDWVVKICWDGDHDGYNKYVDWCLERQGESFVPEIYKVFSHQSSGLRYVFMKRYQDISSDVEDIFQNYISPIAGSQLCGSNFETNEDKLTKLNVVREGLGDYLLKLYKDLGVDYFMDFHYKNVMCDEDGNWIVTDPLASKRPQPIKPKTINVSIDKFRSYITDNMQPLKVDLNWKDCSFKISKFEKNNKVKHKVPNKGAYWRNLNKKFRGRNIRYA